MKDSDSKIPTVRPDRQELSESRARILQAALAEFAEQGVAGARVDRIAERAGVNKALLYYYYQSKENLYRETLTNYLNEAVSAVRLRLDEARNLDQALSSAANHYKNIFINRPELPRLILRELADPQSTLVPAWAEQIRSSGIPDIIQGFMEAEREAGRLREIDPRQALVSFITMQIGYFLMSPLVDQVLQISDREEFIIQRRVAVVDLFLNGVKAR